MPDYLRNRNTAEPSGGERERKFPPQNKPSRTKASQEKHYTLEKVFAYYS